MKWSTSAHEKPGTTSVRAISITATNNTSPVSTLTAIVFITLHDPSVPPSSSHLLLRAAVGCTTGSPRPSRCPTSLRDAVLGLCPLLQVDTLLSLCVTAHPLNGVFLPLLGVTSVWRISENAVKAKFGSAPVRWAGISPVVASLRVATPCYTMEQRTLLGRGNRTPKRRHHAALEVLEPSSLGRLLL
jgi:hypothetical protein